MAYSNIREILQTLLGRTLVDSTQHDQEEFDTTKQAYVMLMFDNGEFVKFFIDDKGFYHNSGEDDDASNETC